MIEQLKERLNGLKQEFACGEEQMAQLDAAREELHVQMLRISGAIQVLEEELAVTDSQADVGEEVGHLSVAGKKAG